MNPITPADIMDAAEYERVRDDFRRRIMVLKGLRRVALGEHATCHFETRDTMLYQVHEMLRVENSWQRPGAVEDELAAYNPLIPTDGRLSATLMLEYETAAERSEWLAKLLGLDRHLWLEIGTTAPLAAEFDQAQVSATRISSVQYVRWGLDDQRRALMATPGTVVRLRIDHPAYPVQAVLGEQTRQELARDVA